MSTVKKSKSVLSEKVESQVDDHVNTYVLYPSSFIFDEYSQAWRLAPIPEDWEGEQKVAEEATKNSTKQIGHR